MILGNGLLQWPRMSLELIYVSDFSILYKLMIIQVAIRLKASTAEKYQQNGVRQDDEKKKETVFL